jgi:hypothetical protein
MRFALSRWREIAHNELRLSVHICHHHNAFKAGVLVPRDPTRKLAFLWSLVLTQLTYNC